MKLQAEDKIIDNAKWKTSNLVFISETNKINQPKSDLPFSGQLTSKTKKRTHVLSSSEFRGGSVLAQDVRQ